MKLRKFILNWILFNLTEARKLYARRRFSEQGVSSRACDSHSVCVASQSNLCERWEGWKNQNEDDNLLARWPQVKLIYFTWRGRNVAYNFMRSGALRSSPAHSNEVCTEKKPNTGQNMSNIKTRNVTNLHSSSLKIMFCINQPEDIWFLTYILTI